MKFDVCSGMVLYTAWVGKIIVVPFTMPGFQIPFGTIPSTFHEPWYSIILNVEL